jgi:hypothetical protein
MPCRFGSTALCLIGLATNAHGQGLIDRILSAGDGTVRLAYAVKDEFCGDGESFIRDHTRGENSYVTFNGDGRSRGKNWRDLACLPGPARVAISKTGGGVTRVKVFVGGGWGIGGSGVTDLGTVSAPQAAKALLALAARERRADDAVFAAILADSTVIWPDLLSMAKNDRAPKGSRTSAVFWLSQAAGVAATKGLTELAEDETGDREVRNQAVFAIAQLPDEHGVPVLIRLARFNKDPEVRRKALFWLGQSDDPRALQLFEEILTKG